MKELIVVRHAKSDWTNENIRDIDRPLSEIGYMDAYTLSKWAKDNLSVPDFVVSSPATRAINTSFIFCRTLDRKESTVYINEKLYESTYLDYRNEIAGFNNKFNRVMLFGHNPAVTNLVNDLNGDLLFENIPTCGIIVIGFLCNSWQEVVVKKEGKLLLNKFPKSYKQ